MTLQVLQRETWYGEPKKLGDAFRLTKPGGIGGDLWATCEIWTHQFGWELRLLIVGVELVQSDVCREQDRVLDTIDAWKAALREKGWTS